MITQKLLWITVLMLLGLAGLAGCATSTSNLRPVEQEQIENVVKDYVVRDTNIPDYEVTIEAVADNWARVSLKPAGVAGEPTFLYLQKQVGVTEAPAAATTVQPGHTARVTTSSGWTIILGPQASFSGAQLDEVGVPEEVRP